MAAAVLHSLAHPSELMALVSFAIHTAKKKGGYFSKDSSLGRKSHNIDRTDTRTECYHFLNLTSRSFAAVVQALDEELRDPASVFLFILRIIHVLIT